MKKRRIEIPVRGIIAGVICTAFWIWVIVSYFNVIGNNMPHHTGEIADWNLIKILVDLFA